MNKWLRKFDEAMAAAAYAEEGEFTAAKELLKGQRKILLVLTGENSDSNSFKYAMNMCKRINAELEILCSEKYVRDTLKQFTSKLKKEAIDYDVTKVSECVKEEVLHFTSERSDIVFVVVESAEGLDMNCRKTKEVVSRSWIQLKCPLVVVSDLLTT